MFREMNHQKLPSLLGALLLLALFSACPKTSLQNDAGQNVNDAGVVVGDAGTTPVVLSCTNDNECTGATICDLSTGDCVPGADCTENPGLCSFCDDAAQECGFTERGYCDAEAGVCRRTLSTCEACQSDEACGESQAGLPNVCADGFCAQGCGACPAGFSCQEGGCVPSNGSCEGALQCGDGQPCPDGTRCSDLGVCLEICISDDECEQGTICFLEPGPLLGQCVNACPLGETLISNGNELICHADGRFGTPCVEEGSAVGCPEGTTCRADGACILPGCQNDDDCDLIRTYCDVASGNCIDGCNDPSDCAAFEECTEGVCVRGGCRGKDVSCNIGEWCCGHEYYEDASTCPAPVEEGECFVTPDPWCRVCNDDNDCADISGDFGHPSYCFELQTEDENGETISVGKFCSVGCESNADCPRGLACQEELPTPEGGTTRGCLELRCAQIENARNAQ